MADVIGCFWCDVKESWDANIHPHKTIEEIIDKAKTEISQHLPADKVSSQPLIVITGGEPLLHNLDGLTLQLRAANFKTHIETSGSSALSGYWDWVCLSPKKFKKPLTEVFAASHELKIIIYNKDDFKWAEENASRVSAKCKLYLQPEWSKSAQVTPLIINYIKANPKWRISMQIHKYINIP
ncbi:MAG: 7-carboxy-7-deazaguanine synthase QueE [Parafilimonas sp.]